MLLVWLAARRSSCRRWCDDVNTALGGVLRPLTTDRPHSKTHSTSFQIDSATDEQQHQPEYSTSTFKAKSKTHTAQHRRRKLSVKMKAKVFHLISFVLFLLLLLLLR